MQWQTRDEINTTSKTNSIKYVLNRQYENNNELKPGYGTVVKTGKYDT